MTIPDPEPEIEPDPDGVLVLDILNIDVAAIRARTGKTQKAFGKHFGINPRTVRAWECGDRRPDPAARCWLVLICERPKLARSIARRIARAKRRKPWRDNPRDNPEG